MSPRSNSQQAISASSLPNEAGVEANTYASQYQHQAQALTGDADFESFQHQPVDPVDGHLPNFFPDGQKAARAYRFRVTEMPQVDPESDPTIRQVMMNREYVVAEMTKAVWALDMAHDKDNSRERQLFEMGTDGCADPAQVESRLQRLLFCVAKDESEAK